MSALQSLKGKEPELVEEVLSEVADRFLPDASLAPRQNSGPEPLVSTVIQEISHRLGISDSDRSRESMTKLFELLAQEMGEAGLTGANLEEIRKRLGGRGDLAPAEYKVVFSNVSGPLDSRTPVLPCLYS
ncbi:MAG TPA: hypothetical protein VI756_18350 [Blastocatellia bacterium]